MENRRPRSSFVTTLAWIFIVLAGFSTLISLLQNIMFNVVFGGDTMTAALQDPRMPPMPAFAKFVLGHVQWIMGGFLAMSILTLVAAIALLRRHNWGRVLFIAIMAAGLVWELGSLTLLPFMFSSFSAIPDTAPPDFRDSFAVMSKVIVAFSVLVSIALSVLFAWIIKRLVSADIRSEFVAD